MIFTGCANSLNYNVTPVYNKSTSTVSIDTLELKNVEKKPSQNLEFITKLDKHKYNGVLETYFFFNENKCERIIYKYVESKDKKAYFPNDFELTINDLYTKKINGKCDVEVLKNLKFIQCNHDENSKESLFYILSSTHVPPIYYDKLALLEVDKMCFDTMKTHFENKAISDNVVGKHYSFGNYNKPKSNPNENNYTQMCNDYLQNPVARNDAIILERYMTQELKAIDPLITDKKERQTRLHARIKETAKELKKMTTFIEINKYQNNPENILYRVNGEDVKEGRLYCIIKNNLTLRFDKMNEEIQKQLLELLKENIVLTQLAKKSSSN